MSVQRLAALSVFFFITGSGSSGGVVVDAFVLDRTRTPGIDNFFSVFSGNARSKRTRTPSGRLVRAPLDMGKGFNNAKNKRAELAKKMAIAKNRNVAEDGAKGGVERFRTEEERKLEEDRARFARMLGESEVTNPNPDERGEHEYRPTRVRPATIGRVTAPKTRKANETKRRKKKRGEREVKGREEDVDKPLREGDIAKRRDFEPLIDCDSGVPLGAIDAARLVPWVPPFVKDCVVILSDPRAQSGDLRRAVQYLTSNLPSDVLEQVIAISSDEVSETRSWKKRVDLETSIRIFSDRNWEWMRRYSTVVSDGRWSLYVVVIDSDGVVREVLRDVEPSDASELVANSVKAMKS